MVLLALARTHDASVAGLVVTGYTLPALASGPLLGAWLDRTRRRRAALAANELVLAASMLGLVGALGRAPTAVCVAIAAAAGITLPLTSAGFTSLIPHLVPPGRLGRANTLDAVSFNATAVLGPAVAGTVAAAVSPAAATLTTAVIALAAVPATLALRMPPTLGADHAAAGVLATARAGLRQMARTPPLRGGTVTTVGAQFAQGIFAVGLPLFAVHLGHSSSAGGALYAALEVGGIAGALAAGWSMARRPPEWVIIAYTALFGVGIVTWPLAHTLPVATVLVAAAGVLSGPVLVATFALRQRHAPGNLLAQVSTTGASLKIGAYALGAAAGGWLVPVAGAVWALVVVAALHLASALAGRLASG